MTTNDLQSYVNEIETQRQKPIEEQLNDLKLAGAKLLRALDNYIKETNNEQQQINASRSKLNDR